MPTPTETKPTIELQADHVALMEADDPLFSDPVFADHRPDQHKAYVRMRFAHSLPVICGPESVSGEVFGLHPAVVARHFQSALHQQTNLGHRLKVSGAPRDRIVGCLVQIAYPEEPEGGWVVPATAAEAPAIHAVAVIWKQAEGVEALLGQFFSGKVPWSVSMEMSFFHDQTGIWDPRTNDVYDRGEIPPQMRAQVMEDERGRLQVRRGSKLVKVIGGKTGQVWFSGLGYVENPAEPTAAIDGIAASKGADGLLVARLAEPEWIPGLPVRWESVPGMWGRGRIVAARHEGVLRRHGKSITGSEADPALQIRLPDGGVICRRASSVRRASEKLRKA